MREGNIGERERERERERESERCVGNKFHKIHEPLNW